MKFPELKFSTNDRVTNSSRGQKIIYGLNGRVSNKTTTWVVVKKSHNQGCLEVGVRLINMNVVTIPKEREGLIYIRQYEEERAIYMYSSDHVSKKHMLHVAVSQQFSIIVQLPHTIA